MQENILNIPAEKLEFAQRGELSGDKKLNTKPVSYMHDAWRRFAKNKSSIVGMAIIIFLLIFSLAAPLITRYDVAYTDLYYKNVTPKIAVNARGGFWDGTSKQSNRAATYYYYNAIQKESGRTAVKKVYGVSRSQTGADLYTYRLDTYEAVGYIFLNLTQGEFFKLQNYQNDTGIQVVYPIQDTSSSAEYPLFVAGDANYWYRTIVSGTKRGEPVFDENGQYIPIYKLTGQDDYDSLRIDGDPGKENLQAENRYRYAQINQTGYQVRVNYYNYYVYQHGFEPLYILGANASGQDLLACVASGTRFSLLLAICVSFVNLIIGAVYGATEGFYGGKTDLIMERIADILSGIPFMVVAVLFNMHLGGTVGAIGALIFAFILTGWISTAATVRMQFYRFKKREYVLAARTLGARDSRLILKHIFPNALGTIVTSAALYIPSVIFSETTLSYLGIISLDDAASGITSLGTLLVAGQTSLSTYPHIMIFPSLVIALLMISFNLFGNGLRDAFNPSLRGG